MAASSETDESDVRDRISTFLMRNFPQIAMHGGSHAIEKLDEETGEVWIELGGACSGCGISPMTIQAIKVRMVEEIPEITQVHADTGMGTSPSFAGGPDGEGYPDAPF